MVFLWREAVVVVRCVATNLNDMAPAAPGFSVRVYRSLEGWGYHCLASRSRSPIRPATAAALAARLPTAARADLVEFGPFKTAVAQLSPKTAREEIASSGRVMNERREPRARVLLAEDHPAPPLGALIMKIRRLRAK